MKSSLRNGSKLNPESDDPAMSRDGLAEGLARPRSVTAWLLDNLRADIVSGKLSEDLPLRQEEIAARYGVSRMPVREALLALGTEGWTVHRPNKGSVVAPLDPIEVEEIFDIRAALEVLALSRSIPLLNNRQREAAVVALNALESASAAKYLEMHRQYHLSLYAAAGPRLLKLVSRELDSANRYLALESTLLGTQEDDREEHRSLLHATLDRDVDAAIDLIRQHVGSAGKDLADALRAKIANASRPVARNKI